MRHTQMKICSDVDGVILDYIQGFIDFTQRENIPYTHNPELYGVIRNFPNNFEVRDRFHAGDSLRQLKYIDGSLKILNFLANRHELHLVTALEPEQFQKRSENLKSVNLGFNKFQGSVPSSLIDNNQINEKLLIHIFFFFLVNFYYYKRFHIKIFLFPHNFFSFHLT